MFFRRLSYVVLLMFLASGAFMAFSAGIPAGPLYRIGVGHTGIVQITPEQLALMGLGNADEVAVYGYGGVAGQRGDLPSDDVCGLPEVPAMVTDDGRLLFYGESTETVETYSPTGSYVYARLNINTADTKGYYFVGAKSDPLRVETLPASEPSRVLSTHWSCYVSHPMTTNPANAGSFFMGDDFSRSPDRTVSIEFPVPSLAPNGQMTARVVGAIKAENPVIGISFGNAVRSLRAISTRNEYNNIETYFVATDRLEIPSAAPAAETGSVKFDAHLRQAGNVAYAAFESVVFTYTRLNVMPADNPAMAMYLHGVTEGDAIALEGAGGTVVWDVSNTAAPRRLGGAYDGSVLTVSLPSGSDMSRLVAFRPSLEQLPVSLEGPAPAIGRLSSMAVPDMVILTAPAFREEAERLAAVHRRCQDMDVAVVEPREVFDEFGSGARSPYAIRRFMKSLYDRSGGRPLSLLIMGSSTYDPAGHVSGSPVDDTHVITYEVENLFKQGYASTCYCNDAFFGFLEDGDLPDDIVSARMSVNVGRIPAVTQAQAVAYVDKVERYLMSPPSVDVRSRALVVCDYGDKNGHLKQGLQLCDSIERRWAPSTTIVKAMAGLYQRATGNRRPLLSKVRETLNEGVGYMAYSGHGNPGGIGSDEFMKRSDISALTNDCCPLVMLATCYALGFDRSENGVGEQFLFNPSGGAMALVGSGRAVQMLLNQYLNLAMAREFYTLTESMTMGDVYRVARNYVNGQYGNSEAAVNTACYNFVGDPALPLYPYTHGIEMSVPAEGGCVVTPLSTNMLVGDVTDSEGAVSHDFNGRVVVRLYAPERTDGSVYDPVDGGTPVDVTRRETLVATVTGKVSDGHFEVSLPCPEVVTPGGGHVITVHALSDDASWRALAMVGDVTVSGMPDDPEFGGAEPPVIDAMWIGSRQFADGDVVDPDISVSGYVIPSPSGLSFTRTLGRTTTLSIDGTCHNDVVSYMTADDDGGVSFSYPLTALTDGNHTAVLTVYDNAGNSASGRISFTVVTRGGEVILETDCRTAATDVTFSLRHNLADEPSGRLVIENEAGEVAFSRPDVSFPFTWDLTDGSGNAVPDGLYTVRAYLRAGLQHMVTPTVRVPVVVGKK